MKPQTIDYEQQAQAFLDKHGIKFKATLSDTKVAPWRSPDDALQTTPPHHYRVTLSKAEKTEPVYANFLGRHQRMEAIKRKANRLVFDFWGSIAGAEKGETAVTPYDVLACISGDVHCPETFADFCGEFSESEDSIKALQTFRRCSAFSKRLRAFFTAQEIEELSEIN